MIPELPFEPTLCTSYGAKLRYTCHLSYKHCLMDSHASAPKMVHGWSACRSRYAFRFLWKCWVDQYKLWNAFILFKCFFCRLVLLNVSWRTRSSAWIVRHVGQDSFQPRDPNIQQLTIKWLHFSGIKFCISRGLCPTRPVVEGGHIATLLPHSHDTGPWGGRRDCPLRCTPSALVSGGVGTFVRVGYVELSWYSRHLHVKWSMAVTPCNLCAEDKWGDASPAVIYHFMKLWFLCVGIHGSSSSWYSERSRIKGYR
jgi:hypothetical protein